MTKTLVPHDHGLAMEIARVRASMSGGRRQRVRILNALHGIKVFIVEEIHSARGAR